MKAYISDDNTLIIEGENPLERMALRAWDDAFEAGDAGFRVGDSEAIQREKPKVRRVGGEWVEA